MATPGTTAFRLEPFDYAEARTLMAELGLAEPVAVTLVRRGYRTPEAARAFLDAADDHDPQQFAQMGEVVRRIRAAIDEGRRITVHGDYDVDGVCSTTIVVAALRRLGADCDWLIPGRLEDGYGLGDATVRKLADRGTSLMITVDCGIGSIAEVEAARAAGIEVIVTDHHQPGEELPNCPILHPVVSGYPCADLCATGVAYKLATALLGAEAARGDLDLVALATVADLVPLRGENRSLVRRGLEEARRARRPGFRALVAAAGIVPERLDEGDFAFRLGPRINAAGRLYRADAAVELFLTRDRKRAEEIASELDRVNHERREVEREVTAAAETARRELTDGLGDAPGLVIAGRGWHPGVVGIVASRLVERHHRPAVLIGLDENGRGRGSGRSVPGFDLLAALHACERHLGRYGGHRAAAGLEIDEANIEAFRRDFAEYVGEHLPEQARVRTEVVDAVVGGESLGHEVAEQFSRLGPFGMGNPDIRLIVPAATVSDVRPMGEGERHARFSLRSGGARARGVAFGVNGSLEAAVAAGPLDVSVRLELNEWNGATEPRVILGELYLDAEPDESARPAAADEIDDTEFWRRFELELERDLEHRHPVAGTAERRELVDRRAASGVATVAALASAGERVLVLSADAIRRRALVERAARPARFGGGELAVVSARLADDAIARAETRVAAAGCGVVLADWAALARDPALAGRFEHIVVVDPAPFAWLDALCECGSGYLHRVAGEPEREFALRVHTDDWPSRAALAALYRSLGAACGAEGIAAEQARRLLCGERRSHPLTPEVAARASRVLCELGLCDWQDSGTARLLMVVSSEGTELERSAAYTAYRARYEEGRRYLSEARQS